MIYIHLLYPYLYVLIPILFLYKINIYEARIKDLLISISIVTAMYIILYFILINRFPLYKTSIIIFNIFIYLFYINKIIYHAIIKPITKLKKVVFIQWLFSTFILVFTYFSIFYNFDIKIIDLFAKTIFVILLFIHIVMLLNIILITKKMRKNNIKDIKDIETDNSMNNNPNIYFIIPDSYPGMEILNQYTEFDNSDFYNFLYEKGFNILKNSFSNYRFTNVSIPSILNMQYLHKCCNKNKNEEIGWDSLKEIISHNLLYSYLIRKNYKITELLNSWEKNMKVISKHKNTKSIFMCKLSYDFISKLFEENIIINYILNIMNAKKNFDESKNVLSFFQNYSFNEKNNFIMAHIIFPHPPFIINEKLSFSYKRAIKYGDLSSYKFESEKVENMINQIRYTNNILKDIVENILKYDKESIIIIQSDHGNHMTRFLGKKDTDNKDYDKTHYNILRAVYYKGEKININSKTSVNTFREIFNILFDDNLDILEENILVNEPYNNWGSYNKYFYEVNIDDL